MPSDVQVFVRFKEQCIFAGEELNCVITFKNVAEHPEPPTPGADPLGHKKRNSISQLIASVGVSNLIAGPSRAQNIRSPSVGHDARPRVRHQSSYSLSSPSTPVPREASPSNEPPVVPQRSTDQHQRSVSIISMNTPSLASLSKDGARVVAKPRSHRRSSTVIVSDVARRSSQPQGQLSADSIPGRLAGRRSPLSASHSPSDPEREAAPNFRFPSDRAGSHNDRPPAMPPSSMPKTYHRRDLSTASRATDTHTTTDIYSHSNHSGETLMSEQISMAPERLTARSRMPSERIRKQYKNNFPYGGKPQATTLLMGYAQVSATFTLDASLVDQAPFEEVKKKGFLGGQSGGGVVGVKKKARPSSGLWGGFNFASLGESLDSIMGGESSGVKEMKAVTNSRSIPLLSTPQSLLFVDAHLEPGDEKSFSFNFRLPRGLPASFRGKAIKIVYNLTIGVQGAPGAQQQVSDVRQINVPFRVFPGVDSDGEILGHDLMQPHVILKDLAKTRQLDNSYQDYFENQPTNSEIEAKNIKLMEFMDSLLDRNRRRQSSSSLIMEAFKPVGGPVGSSQSQALKIIDHTIMNSNYLANASDNSTSPNRFEIASGGRRIAVVSLDRPLHRLGETVTVVVDFSNSDVVCSSLRSTLETCEKVTASLAVRSSATIARITRKVYASRAENVLFTQRSVFTPAIPVLVSPTFITSGVSLEWNIKLEFGTVKELDKKETDGDGEVSGEQNIDMRPALLEELVNDERGIIEVAAENLDCDTFEVTIPLTVYGDIVQDGDMSADDVIGVSI